MKDAQRLCLDRPESATLFAYYAGQKACYYRYYLDPELMQMGYS